MLPQVSCDNWNLMLLSLHTKPQKSTHQAMKIKNNTNIITSVRNKKETFQEKKNVDLSIVKTGYNFLCTRFIFTSLYNK